jgi:hypothetical protein
MKVTAKKTQVSNLNAQDICFVLQLPIPSCDSRDPNAPESKTHIKQAKKQKKKKKREQNKQNTYTHHRDQYQRRTLAFSTLITQAGKQPNPFRPDKESQTQGKEGKKKN